MNNFDRYKYVDIDIDWVVIGFFYLKSGDFDINLSRIYGLEVFVII